MGRKKYYDDDKTPEIHQTFGSNEEKMKIIPWP